MELPVYDLKVSTNVNDDAEVSFIALVDEPAIQRDFILFNADKMRFEIVSDEQRIISGPLMIAEQLIYRNSEKMGEHYVKFSKNTIKDIAIKYAKKGYHKNVNLMHEPSLQVEGVTLFESFLSDKARGIMPMKGFDDVADGSWFGSFFVENEKVWAAAKDGKFRGFSVEGMFNYDEPTTTAGQLLNKIAALLKVKIS